ncbi:MAG: hypothetical protein ACOC2D_18020, partial [Spirochaetota bacterium]
MQQRQRHRDRSRFTADDSAELGADEVLADRAVGLAQPHLDLRERVRAREHEPLDGPGRPPGDTRCEDEHDHGCGKRPTASAAARARRGRGRRLTPGELGEAGAQVGLA